MFLWIHRPIAVGLDAEIGWFLTRSITDSLNRKSFLPLFSFSSSIFAHNSIFICRQGSPPSLVSPPSDHKPHAFTLVELAVVIAIVAVMTALHNEEGRHRAALVAEYGTVSVFYIAPVEGDNLSPPATGQNRPISDER